MPDSSYYIGLAKAARLASKDRSRRVGAVIVDPIGGVLTTGYNGFPRGINDDIEYRHERPAKYRYTEHSERNAVYQAARRGVATEGCTMYTWAEGSGIGVCSDCARAIIQAGIIRVVLQRPDNTEGATTIQPNWPSDDLAAAMEMLLEAGVNVDYE